MKTENDLGDEELELLEEECRVVEDKWDRLYLLQQLLVSSRVEQMYKIKRASSLGPTCPYYLKSKRLFAAEEETKIISLLQQLINDW